MTVLLLGLIVFLGVHSVRMVAPAWRDVQLARFGEMPWKGTFAVISLLGFALLIYGYGQARLDPVVLWVPPVWTKHLVAPLMLVAFICVAAAYIPGNIIKAKVGHPMLAGTKTWALAHLLANGNLADVLLFGAFLIWSVLEFRTFRLRDKAAGVTYPRVSLSRDLLVLATGVIGTAVFMLFLHQYLIGVRPY
ncbi:MAG TPA: NnrU family protein [Rhodocyclaceae bacterium]|nr:NnrU family protein [Rhodocyclaceae bacterium]